MVIGMRRRFFSFEGIGFDLVRWLGVVLVFIAGDWCWCVGFWGVGGSERLDVGLWFCAMLLEGEMSLVVVCFSVVDIGYSSGSIEAAL